jgi:hypothetical protein
MDNTVRLNKILRELNITTSQAADTLANKGHLIDPRPTTKLTEQQVTVLRAEFQKSGTKLKEITDFEIGQHYDFEIKENRENFTIVHPIGQASHTYTSDRIYQQPGDKIKLYVRKFKENGEPILTFSILNSYAIYENYLFDATVSPRKNGYLLENNEYHKHFVPLSFKYLIEDGTIKLKVSGIDEENNKLIFEDFSLKEVKMFSSNGETSLINGEDYKFEVLGLKQDYNDEHSLITLGYKGKEYTTKALGFQKEYGLPKWVYCTVNKDQYLRLYQNFLKSFKEIFEVQKPYTFKVIDEITDQNDALYYAVQDQIGFVHRFYKNQVPSEIPPKIGDDIELFVSEINEKGKHLKLDWYQKDIGVQKEFYSPDRIFNALEGYSVELNLYNLQEFIDVELKRIHEDSYRPPYLELFSQIENENNNWFFSYLSLLSQYNNSLIKQHQYEKARQSIELYIDLEEWLIDSDFIAAYSKLKRQEIIDNAESIRDKQEAMLNLISDLEHKRHYKKLEKIHSKLQKLGIISRGDMDKTIQYLKWDNSLLTTHYDLVYGVIHALLDNDCKIASEDLSFLNQITTNAYTSTFTSRNFVLTAGIHELNDFEKEELEIENKHLFVQIRLNEKLEFISYAITKSAELLRNLALVSTDGIQKKRFLLQSIDVIIKEVTLSIFSNSDFEDTLELSEKLEKKLNAKPSNKGKLFYHKNSGVVISTEQSWLISNQITSFDNELVPQDSWNTLVSLCEDRLKVITSEKLMDKYDKMDISSATFWGTYVNNRKTFTNDFDALTLNKLSQRQQYIRSVIKSLDYIISLETDVNKKIEALQTAKLITVIMRDNKSYYYHEMLRFYYRVNGLVHNVKDENFEQPVNYETLEKFPVLKKIQSIHSVINLIGNNDTSVLNDFLESEDGNIKSITKMVLAYNIVLSEFPDQKEVNHHLLSLIEAKILNKALFIETPSINIDNVTSINKLPNNKQFQINDGREDIVTEFKTSIVYHPESKEPKIHKQVSQIVKVITAFLNARGGKLYLGVKDNGFLVGLESDFKQLEVNSDGYERLVRKYIVNYTNTTVNGLLEFKFINEDSLEYLIINISPSETLVDFKGDFYQRQGSETRLIKGQDLSNLFQKKLNVQTTLFDNNVDQQVQGELTFLTELSNVYDSNKIVTTGFVSKSEGLYDIGIFDDRTWVWTDAGKDFDFGAPQNFTISDKDSYILICYSEGRLAKFRTRSFLSRNKNERQRNTFALRPDSEIVRIFEIKEDVNFLVQSVFNKEVYLKIVNSSEAGDVRNSLASQGTYFIDSNNDGILSIQPINLEEIDSNYDKIQMSKQTLGIDRTSYKITDLVEELKIKSYL